jgi:hypothetical protein
MQQKKKKLRVSMDVNEWMSKSLSYEFLQLQQ